MVLVGLGRKSSQRLLVLALVLLLHLLVLVLQLLRLLELVLVSLQLDVGGPLPLVHHATSLWGYAERSELERDKMMRSGSTKLVIF